MLDARPAFRERVVTPFVEAYRAGTTPSPCVACNQEVKLGRLLDIARDLGATRVATGHYARIEADASNEIRLLRGIDSEKDQSYFLYGVPAEILARCLFPHRGLQKHQTRAEGRRLGVPNWDKKDSQELCFVPDGDVGGFIERETGARASGEVVDEHGAVLATHEGVYRFTVGQRRGLGLGGGAPPRFVLRVLPEAGRVVVGGPEALTRRDAHVRAVAWAGPGPEAPFEAEVQIRHRHAAAPALVTPTPEGFDVAFVEAQRAIAPGQAAVVYRGDQVIGGGVLSA